MIRPAQQDEVFLADVVSARSDPSRAHVWWLGQSGFLVLFDGQALLLDPYLSDSLTRKYAATARPHVRLTERVVAPERLGFVGVASSSHNHTDHLDAETLGPLMKANPELRLVAPEANRRFVAERLGIPAESVIGVDAGGAAAVGPWRFHAVPAAHETLERDDQGRHKCLGYVVEFGHWRLYHSGDTVRYDGMAEALSPWRVDLALLPINGRGPERGVAGNLWGREAAQLARDIGARLTTPCHYDLFEFNTATPDEFVAEARRLAVEYRVLRAGERLSLS